ncbi:MAG: DUF3231 family protein, partial [Bacillota bacterium]
NIQLTAAEIGTLWYQYMSDSMALQVLTVFCQQVEDKEIRPIVEYAKGLSQKHLQKISEMLSGEKVPLPNGFTDEDIDLAAPKLFSDPFYLSYIRNMGRIGLQRYGLALTGSARADVRSFLHECVRTSAELDERATRVQLSKGLYIRAPYIPVPERTAKVDSNEFLGSLFGHQRPLLATEIDHIFVNAQSNTMGKALFIGFSQVAQETEIRNYFLRGQQIAHKQIEVFSDTLKREDLPVPMTVDSYVTSSAIPPFSDKLMMYHAAMLETAGLGNYGVSISMSMRIDIAVMYARFMMEIGRYIKTGAQLIIKHGWMEKPPQAVDRKALALSR